MKIKYNDYKRELTLNPIPSNLPDPQISITYPEDYSYLQSLFGSKEKLEESFLKHYPTVLKELNHPKSVNNYRLTYYIDFDKQIYLVGDLHGNYKRFKEEILEKDYRNCVFIMLGDQVMLFDDSWKQYRKLDNLFRERNCIAYFIRGNHDCPYFHTQEYFALHFTNIFPMNMGIIKYRTYTGFVFGGAISLNRMLMEEDKNFWARYDYIDPWKNLYRDFTFDFIIGHTGPIPEGIIFNSSCEKFLSIDKELRDDLEKEQNDLTDMLCHMTPKHWFMGHYHKNKNYILRPFEKKDYECNCHMVDVNCVLDFSQYYP